jgi:hypothetical protein
MKLRVDDMFRLTISRSWRVCSDDLHMHVLCVTHFRLSVSFSDFLALPTSNSSLITHQGRLLGT